MFRIQTYKNIKKCLKKYGVWSVSREKISDQSENLGGIMDKKCFFCIYNMEKGDLAIANLVLPEGILEFFGITEVSKDEKDICIYLSEHNVKPEAFSQDKLSSKGFFDEIKVQDFPIRGKGVYLLIKRRRWVNESTGEIVFRNWEHVAKGTRLTKEFATFLKAIARY